MTHRIRTIDSYTVETLTVSDDATHATILTTDSTGFSQPIEIAAQLQPGTVFDLETVNLSLITGIRVDGRWILHKTDADLDEEHAALVRQIAKDDADRLLKNRTDWDTRQQALPDWLRARLTHFHTAGGEAFRLNGWGYELVVCELAALYVASEGDETTEIGEYAERHGTSGNQHGCAKSIARIYRAGGWDTYGPIVAFFNDVATAFGAVVSEVAAAFDALGQAWIQAAADRDTGRNPYTALAEVERTVVSAADRKFDAAARRLQGVPDDAETHQIRDASGHVVKTYWTEGHRG